MKYSNKLNLPESFSNFYKSQEEVVIPNRYSVTELLKPVQEIMLYRKHINQISIDISECIPALFGTAVHELLEKNAPENCLSEYKFEEEINGKILVGKCDLLDLTQKILTDYKTSSVSKVTKQDFEDYYLQGMMYAYLTYLKFNIKISKIRFPVLLKDWSKIKSYSVTNYPQSPIYMWEYAPQDSDLEYIIEYINNKFKEIDDNISECTDKDKWYSGDKYAVYKLAGDARAKKVFDTYSEAELFKVENNCEYIEKRLGENIKCNYYCNVKEFCKQYRKEKQNGEKSI